MTKKELEQEVLRLKEVVRQLKELVKFTETSAAAGLIPASNLKGLIENKRKE